jgi:hypothetical protein
MAVWDKMGKLLTYLIKGSKFDYSNATNSSAVGLVRRALHPKSNAM